ncbi:MAG: type II toxin-antitoxin system VapC family toxin [Synoicihabitans sp.]
MKPSRCKYLLDTHALIWAAMDEGRLGRKSARAIATTAYTQLALADVSLQEIGLLLHLNKIKVTGKPDRVLGTLLNYVTVLPITPDIAIRSPALTLPHGDQFDRIITATAQVHRLTLITKDANITDSGIVPCLW